MKYSYIYYWYICVIKLLSTIDIDISIDKIIKLPSLLAVVIDDTYMLIYLSIANIGISEVAMVLIT